MSGSLNSNQQTAIPKDCPGIKLNVQSLEVVGKFYLGDKIEARTGCLVIFSYQI